MNGNKHSKYKMNEYVRTLNGVANITHVFRNENKSIGGRRYQITYCEFKDTVILNEINIIEVIDINDFPEYTL